MTKSYRTKHRETLAIKYRFHKELRHYGVFSMSCTECAEFEWELMQNKTRRDSE